MSVYVRAHLNTCDSLYVNHTSIKLQKNYDHTNAKEIEKRRKRKEKKEKEKKKS